MKFSEIEKNIWEEHQEYLDTCVLPYTGLTGDENPMETTKALEDLRDILEWIEIPFKGRVVTYPAVHFSLEGQYLESYFKTICLNLKKQGFKYIILISHRSEIHNLNLQDFGLLLTPSENEEENANLKEEISNKVQALWNNNNDS
ncbi:DUF2487 family protein [Chengkuizengella sediminis]|uniref:DUF2487 family protein n=1 Tax=Chengkuizengella sediminis TaxID=1885917 RepID=UPI00138A1B0D|nr:DUF2487 family protein [Chengkuizengella sediminis]NDI34373.1 DUF2487 family protein [Chengkuizengella sediminis]